jgi:hypothetical protein
MREDRETTQNFLDECQKFDFYPIVDNNKGADGDDTPFYGGGVNMM